MRECEHVSVCGNVGDAVGSDGYCVLHRPGASKSQQAFDDALDEHLERLHYKEHGEYERIEDWLARVGPWPGDTFDFFHFPGDADFAGSIFSPYGTSFEETTFHGTADFDSATFQGGAIFEGTTFIREANFETCSFEELAAFGRVQFQGGVDCTGVEWRGEVRFLDNTLYGDAAFSLSKFHARTVFAGRDAKTMVFQDVQVDFRDVQFLEPASVTFRNADLRRTFFLNTDLREIEFTNVPWCTEQSAIKRDQGLCIYDEIAIVETGRPLDEVPWGELARIYRRLKQTYEDQRDYGRGGSFHFREKEMMRRKYAAERTGASVSFFLLHVYYHSSGYGERLWSAGWILLLITVSALLYLQAGIGPWDALSYPVTLERYGETLVYSVQVTFFHRPTYLEPKSPAAQMVLAVNMIAGPILIGLFALAIRQRLRR